MGEAAKKLSPEELENKRRHNLELIEDIRPIDRANQAQEAGPAGEEYQPPDLQLIKEGEEESEEDEETGDENEEDQATKPTSQSTQRVQETPEEQLEKGEVPKYVKESPEAYKQPPGGPAVQPGESNLTDKEIRDKDLASSEIDPKTGQPRRKYSGLKGSAKALHNRYLDVAEKFSRDAIEKAIKDYFKKIAAQVAKAIAQAASKAAAAAVANPYVLGAILIIILLIGLGIAAIALWPNRSLGTTPVQAADILGDRPWISKILALANDPNIASKLETSLTELESGIATLESDMARPPLNSLDAATQTMITTKIAEIRQQITNFRTLPAGDAKRPEVAKNIVTAVSQLVDLFAPAPCHYNGPTAYPIEASKIGEWPKTSPHTGSYIHPQELKSGHGLFINNRQGIGDAVDIPAPNGTPVHAIFSGKYTESSNVNGWEVWIEGQDQQQQKFVAVYAHMRENSIKIRKNQDVQVGSEIGVLNSIDHLHLEVYCNGRPVVTTKSEVADAANNQGKYGNKLGKYLYVRILNVFNLPPPF